MAKLGYSSVTLTDLTDTLPILLVLESNLPKSVQTKTGNKYDPDYTQEGVIITPSLYLGQEDLQIEKHPYFVDPEDTGEERNNGYIQYEIGNEIFYYGSSTENSSIYVDKEGKLHYKKNLEDNITIEAYIRNFYLPDHNTTVELVQATNPITIVLLEDSNNYYAVIECIGGREHFEDSNAGDITMVATLYHGTDILNYDKDDYSISKGSFDYFWDALGDGNSVPDSTSNILTVQRSWIFNREYYTCIITDNSTGLTYSASKLIQDFTDTYDCNIEYDVVPIFTDEEKTITLTAETYYRSERLEGKQGFNLSYAWIAKSKATGTDEIVLEEDSSILKITNSTLPDDLKQQDFIVYCKVFQTTTTNECYQIAGDTLVISYTSPFSVNIEGQTIFVPTSSQGNYQGNAEKKYTFKFQLLGEDGQPITYNSSGSGFPRDINTENPTISFLPKEPIVWDFEGTITLATENWANLDSSMMYSFSYTYLGQVFTETITVVKQFKGQDGDQGFSGYTIDLSNEFHTFSGGEMRADSGQEAICEVLAFYGDNGLYIQEIKIDDDPIIYSAKESKGKIKYTFGDHSSSLFFTATSTEAGKATITIETNEDGESDFLMDIQPIPLYISVSENQSDSSDKWKTFYKQFSYTINYYGKSYRLNLSDNNIKYSEPTNTYTPSQITVSATVLETNGAINNYSAGKIIYSLDDGTTWQYCTGSITGYSALKNIIIRLYSSLATDIDAQANLTPTLLSDNAQYLLDMETIPVLTSMEGYEFGGENLIRWSKFMPLSNNKWEEQSANEQQVLIKEESGFGVVQIYLPKRIRTIESQENNYNQLFTPKIQIQSNWYNRNFTISGYIYFGKNSEEIENIDKVLTEENQRFEIWLSGYQSYNKLNKEYDITFKLGQISNSNLLTDLILENREGNKWIKFSKTFTFSTPEDFKSINNITLEKCSYFSLDFCCFDVLTADDNDQTKDSFICLKQLQLELGNVASEWRSSPYDIDIEDISGLNLLNNEVKRTISFTAENNYKYLIAEKTALEANSFYSLSFSKIVEKTLKSGSLFLVLQDKEGRTKKIISQIQIPYDKISILIEKDSLEQDQLFLYSYNPAESDVSSGQELICIIDCLKLEKGTSSTFWNLTNQQIEEILSLDLKEYDLIDENGNKISFATTSDFENYITRLSKIETEFDTTNEDGRINALQSNYNTITSSVNDLLAGEVEGYLGKISQGRIQLGFSKETGEPALILSYQSGGEDNFSMQLTNDSLVFYNNSQPLATMSGYILDIPFLSSKSIRISNIIIKKTTSGVGILWEE